MKDFYDFINFTELKKYLDELQFFEGELPLVLFEFLSPLVYLGNLKDDSVIRGFYDRKHDIQIVENPLEYMEYDLKVWVDDNPEFKSIYIGEG